MIAVAAGNLERLALGDSVTFYKIGLELFTAEGPEAVIPLRVGVTLP